VRHFCSLIPYPVRALALVDPQNPRRQLVPAANRWLKGLAVCFTPAQKLTAHRIPPTGRLTVTTRSGAILGNRQYDPLAFLVLGVDFAEEPALRVQCQPRGL
jgi:hypothetical protein